MPEAIVAALGAAAVGAVWSSCSPDFGVQGVLDRFGQIEPRVLVAADGYFYGGKTHDSLEPASPRSCAASRRSSTRDRRAVRGRNRLTRIASIRAALWHEFVDSAPAANLAFEPLPFNHPLYILYSSGTTGVPKCIVHGAGGTLMQHLKEHQLHCDIQRGDRVFYFTTAAG